MVTDKIAARLADLHPTVVEVSVYGADAETHDRVTLVPGSFHRTVQGVQTLRGHGVRVHLRRRSCARIAGSSLGTIR